MIAGKVFSETTLFMHLSKDVFGSQKPEKYLSYEGDFSSKIFKI